MGSPPKIEIQPCDTGKNSGRESAGSRWRKGKPAIDRACRVLEGEGVFRFACEEGETVAVVEDGVFPVPGGTVYGGHASLACGQGYNVRCGGTWW